MHESDSNLANVSILEEQLEDSKNTICIQGIKQVLSGLYKIHPTAGPVFFVRDWYFGVEHFEKLLEDFEAVFFEDREKGEKTSFCLTEEQSLLLLDASEAYLAERYAMGLLNRSEQSRFLLFQKLLKKKFRISYINEVLDFLEHEGHLSDLRFSEAWLRQRMRSKKESRTKLYQELLSRSISSQTAKRALDTAFEDVDEEEILRDLIDSYISKGFDRDKIIKKCVYYGFPLKGINTLL